MVGTERPGIFGARAITRVPNSSSADGTAAQPAVIDAFQPGRPGRDLPGDRGANRRRGKRRPVRSEDRPTPRPWTGARMHPLAAAQTRKPQRRVPRHADAIPAPRHRQDDRAAKRPELGRPDPYRHRDLSIVTSAKLPEPHPANARRPIRTAIRRREPRLRIRRPRRRRQRLPHHRPVPSRPPRQEPLRRGAAPPITARDRTPHEQATRHRRHDHQHAEQPYTATRPRAAADRSPRPSAAPTSAGSATAQQHRARPRARAPHNENDDDPSPHSVPQVANDGASRRHLDGERRAKPARTPNQSPLSPSRTVLDLGNMRAQGPSPRATAATLRGDQQRRWVTLRPGEGVVG